MAGTDQMLATGSSNTVHILSIPLPSSNNYPYNPVDPNHNEIRLLHARPSEVDGRVNCTLSHVSLDTNPSYEALSYTWCDGSGNADLNKQLLIDGHVVAVTRNLEAALRQLLTRDVITVLWVDALCIDQTNIGERNEQVGKMKLVYQRAQRVISWLGDEHDDSQEAFQLLNSFRELGVKRSMYDTPEPDPRTAVLSHSIEQKALALIRFFQREYWKRAWVVQEIAFARRLVVYCGSDHMTWDEMKSACKIMMEDADFLFESLNGSSVGHISWLLVNTGPFLVDVKSSDPSNEGKSHIQVERIRGVEQDAGLTEMLIRHRGKKATDPRDKVYSLFGLFPAELQNRLPVDYNLDTQTVFQNLATFLATEEHDLRILSENKLNREQSSSVDKKFYLPTWVPNWAYAIEAQEIRLDRMVPWGLAAGLSIPEAHVQDRNILNVKGVRIGTISAVGNVMPDFIHQEFDFSPVFETLYSWWLIFLSVGRKDIVGEKGLVELLTYGYLYASHNKSLTPEKRDMFEQEVLMDLKSVLSVNKKDDTTMASLLSAYEPHVDGNTLRKAETNIWSVSPVSRLRRFIIVDGKDCGIGSQCTEVGDLAVVVPGCNVPLVLRRRADEQGGGYSNLGDAYVEGFMTGQATSDCVDGKREFERFQLH